MEGLNSQKRSLPAGAAGSTRNDLDHRLTHVASDRFFQKSLAKVFEYKGPMHAYRLPLSAQNLFYELGRYTCLTRDLELVQNAYSEHTLDHADRNGVHVLI